MELANNLSKTTISVNQTPISIDKTFSDSEKDSDKGRDVVIASAIVILCAIIMICAMLCYREISRRRMEADMFDEYLRKEEIKRTIKKKIAQMQNLEDSDSYVEEMRLKVPLVTFGDVTSISPAHSIEALHLQAHHHHHHHYHHHHHHHLHSKQLVCESKNKNGSLLNGGKEKHWYSSPHKIPTRGRLLSFLFGNDKKRKEEISKQNQIMYLEMADRPATVDNQSSAG